MYKNVIEKYAKKGWLKYGMKTFSSMERLWAAGRLYSDYVKSRRLSVGVVNPLEAKVDGGLKNYAFAGSLKAKDDFLKAFSVLSPLWKKMIECVVLEDKELEVFENGYEKNIKKAKKELSAALDCLILHYMAQKQKRGER